MTDTRRRAAIVIAALAVLLGTWMRYESMQHAISGAASSCKIAGSEKLDCDAVQGSIWGTLGGVSMSTWGAAGNLILLWLLVRRLDFAAGVLALFGAVAGLAMLGSSAFLLGKFCLYCSALQLCTFGLAYLAGPGVTRRESRLVPAIVPALLVLALAMTGDAWADRRAELLHLMQPHGGKAFRIDVSDAMLLGDPTTPVSTVVYFDFGCPICRGCYYKARQIVDQHPRKVHFYFKHWPLDRACNKGVGQTQHAASCRAAGAGTVATQQGKTREAMDYLFSKAAMGEPFSWFVLERLARTVGLRQKEWRARIESPATQALVVRDAVEGTELGFDGVPQVFVSGRYCEPAYMEKRILRAYSAAKKKQ